VGGRGEVYLREEYLRGEPELCCPDGEIAGGGYDNGERRKRKKEGLDELLYI
jgi:hypothetical protein